MKRFLTVSAYQACLGAVLIICAIASVLWSWHWPLVGDASLMHYVVFLMHHGSIPYRNIVDVNLPGSYLAEAAAMRIFGWGSLAWRIYDLVLLLIGIGACVQIAKRKSIFGGIFAGIFFLLLHVQDGLAQLGQRDLLIAVLLVCSYVVLYYAQERPRSGLVIFLYGLLVGATVMIKPFFLPLALILILLSAKRARERGLSTGYHISFGFFGLILPSSLAIFWLWSHGALSAFFDALRTLIPFHASLGHKTFAYLLTHSTAPIMPLCILWIALWIWRRRPLDLEQIELLIGAAVALLAYVLQGKGYPYHRYPLLMLLLLLMGMDFAEGLTQRRWIKGFSVLALAYACFFMAPRAAWMAQSFQAATPFEDALAQKLQEQKINLSGNVQCLDTFGGCINTLYNLRVVQATDFLYDCYLFEPDNNKAVERYRAAFWKAYQQAHPEIVVLTSQYCFGPDNFKKLDAWPQLRDDLSHSYTQLTEWHPTQPQHWWARREMPSQFRIYIRKQSSN